VLGTTILNAIPQPQVDERWCNCNCNSKIIVWDLQ